MAERGVASLLELVALLQHGDVASAAAPLAHQPRAGLELELPLNVEIARALQLAGKAGELALDGRR